MAGVRRFTRKSIAVRRSRFTIDESADVCAFEAEVTQSARISRLAFAREAYRPAHTCAVDAGACVAPRSNGFCAARTDEARAAAALEPVFTLCGCLDVDALTLNTWGRCTCVRF